MLNRSSVSRVLNRDFQDLDVTFGSHVLNGQLSNFDSISNCLSWDEMSHLVQVADDYKNLVASFTLGSVCDEVDGN